MGHIKNKLRRRHEIGKEGDMEVKDTCGVSKMEGKCGEGVPEIHCAYL